MALSNLPAKVIAKAFRAGFHLTTQRAFPWPVGSSDRVVRYTPLDTEQLRVGGAGSLSTHPAVVGLTQFVFQEVAKELSETPPRSVRPGVWDTLLHELATDW